MAPSLLSNKLTLADRVETRGASPLIVSAGTSLTTVGVDARVGSLQSRASVILRDRARATGVVLSSGTVTRGAGAGADGGIQSNVPLALDSLSTFAVTFPAPGGPISLEPDQRLTVTPGSYGSVAIKSRSVIYLSAGDYYFLSLILEPQSAIVVDPTEGPVRIYVKSGLVFRGAMIDHLGGTPSVLVAYFGTTNGLLESSFDGTLVAPKAKVVLGSVVHSGAFYARELEVQAGAKIDYIPSPVTWFPSGPDI